jgi:hypothetical protein
MKYGTVSISNDYAYLLPISDAHIGDKSFHPEGYKKLQENIEWVRKEKHARVFLNGDILNVATRGSKTSPFEQDMNLREQVEFAVKIFTPIKDKIDFAIDGNHELRIMDMCGYSPTVAICHELGIKYYGYSAVMCYTVGRGGKKGRGNRISYVVYAHHTNGGGATPGGKMNRIDKLRQIVVNADLYVGSHNHQLGVIPVTSYVVDTSHGKINQMRQVLVDTGGYLGWEDNYSEAKMLPPGKIGSPRIRLSGVRHDVHVSV